MIGKFFDYVPSSRGSSAFLLFVRMNERMGSSMAAEWRLRGEDCWF